MSDSWNDMRRVKEEMFFEEQNKRALAKLKERAGKKPRLSPITGEEMEQISYQGVVIDRCKTSGGIWLDAGELEEIIKNASDSSKSTGTEWFSGFMSFLGAKKP